MGCLVLSTFTLLPVIKVENANTITMGGLLMLGSGVVYLIFQKSITSRSRSQGAASAGFDYVSRSIMGAQVGIILLAILVTRSSIASLQAKQGLPLGNQVTGWLVLITSLGLPFAHRIRPNNHYFHRLLIIFLAFSPSFVLLTISYEGLFYFAFCTTLITWVRLEHSIYVFNQRASESSPPATSAVSATSSASPPSVYRTLTLSDARVALFFLFLLQSAFFSTGNIASVSSFSLDAVYRLIPIFDPFAQGALLLFKILVPFAIISANLGILNRQLGVAPSALFMLVMAVSDVMTLNFFWMVKDEGSWLDIGTTISHFVIGSLLSVFVAGLEFLSEVLISGVEVDMRDTQQIGGVDRHDLALGLDARAPDKTGEKPQKLANGHSIPNGAAVPA
jgi:phosphatidylinositol glycan class N